MEGIPLPTLYKKDDKNTVYCHSKVDDTIRLVSVKFWLCYEYYAVFSSKIDSIMLQAPAIADEHECAERGRCRNGSCVPYCETQGMHSCMCDIGMHFIGKPNYYNLLLTV